MEKLFIDVCGFDKSEIKLTASKRSIRLTGDKQIEGKIFNLNETIALNPDEDYKAITATVSNGLLILTIPKLTKQESPNQSITIL